jgi:hypothetical protein
VCRAKNTAEGTTAELFLDWNGNSAKGTLRTRTGSGMVGLHKVEAERYKGAIIADDTSASDLVVHAAVVGERHGRKYIRLGEWNERWWVCE